MINKQKGIRKPPRNRLHNALLTLNFLNANEKGTSYRETLDNEKKTLWD